MLLARPDRGGNIIMYAIFESGGKQYKVAAGDTVRVEKLPDAEGAKVKFDKVLAIADGKETYIGTPYLDAATVNAVVTEIGKGDKVIVYKYKAKKGYRRKQGHRQPFTAVEIESVSLGGKTVFKREAPKKPDKPAAKKDDEGEKPAEAKASDAKVEAEPVEAKASDTKAEAKPAAEQGQTETKADDAKADTAAAPKATKADIISKLDELGATYSKSAKKDELLAILAEAEKK
jgi:large subunit ribosomal protein L21